MAESVAEWRVRVALQISRAQWQGTVRRDRDAAVLAAYLWDVWQGGLLAMKLAPSTDGLTQAIDMTLDDVFAPRD